MDTRNKIVGGEIPLDNAGARTLIIGYFDPVYAEHVRRLRSLGEHLIVAIDEPVAPLLPWRARAELVASLACVDYVIRAEAAASVNAARIVDQREEDTRARQALMEHILARHDA